MAASNVKRKNSESKDYYQGTWNGKSVRFRRVWNGHRFTDGECEALCNGDAIVFQANRRKDGRLYLAKGMLSEQEYSGRKYVGFGLCMVPEGVYLYDESKLDPKWTDPQMNEDGLTNDEDQLFAEPLSGGVSAKPKEESFGLGVPDYDPRGAYGLGTPVHRESDQPLPEGFVFPESKHGVLDKVAAVGKSVAGVSAVAGIAGVSATVSAVKKSKEKKDRMMDSLADDVGAGMGMLFAGNEWERRMASKAVSEITGKPGMERPPRRLPPPLPEAKASEDEPELG